MSEELKNLVSRALWTFLETAIAAFVGIEIAFNVESLLAAIIAASMAGGAAALSVIKTFAQDRARALGA